MIEEIKDEDENKKIDTKRTLGGRKEKSFGDASLELAKLHVSYKAFIIILIWYHCNFMIWIEYGLYDLIRINI